jgi:DnaK suppressor protein
MSCFKSGVGSKTIVDANQILNEQLGIPSKLKRESNMVKTPLLTAAQMQQLSIILETRHDLLQKQASLDFGSLVKTAKDGIDAESTAFFTPNSNASAEQDLTERHTNEMHAIEHAFLRIHQGTYGICVDCQSSIDYPRLLAYPTALRCMKCQEAYEHHEKRGSIQRP